MTAPIELQRFRELREEQPAPGTSSLECCAVPLKAADVKPATGVVFLLDQDL